MVGVDCYGWVEVNDPRLHRPTQARIPKWSAVICIDEVVDRNYAVYGFFFNVYNHPDTAIASRRGLPSHPSEHVEADTAPLGNTLTAATWILWSEVLASHWQASITLSAGWSLLFGLMERLAADYGNDRVRLVIWFDDDQRV